MPSIHIYRNSTEEEMDGEAIISAFNALTGPECLKDVIPKFGQRQGVQHDLESRQRL